MMNRLVVIVEFRKALSYFAVGSPPSEFITFSPTQNELDFVLLAGVFILSDSGVFSPKSIASYRLVFLISFCLTTLLLFD